MINDRENCGYINCGVEMDEFPRMGTCCRKNDDPVASYEKVCIWCSIWTSLPEGASLKTATIFECGRLGYGRRMTAF